MQSAEAGSQFLRLLLVDYHNVVRAGLSMLLGHEPDFLIVAQGRDGAEAVRLWEEHQPDVTLMDLNMPTLGGIAAIRSIRKLDSLAVILVLSTYDGDEDIYNALRAGAKGYLLKDTEPAELFAAIRRARSGKTCVSADIAAKLARRLGMETLSDRESQVVQLVVHGQSNKVIARELDIAEGTVKTHLKRIFDKLDATSRTEAAAVALKRGIVHL